VLQSLGSYHASLGNHKEAERLLRTAVDLLPADADPAFRALVECTHASTVAQLGDADAGRATLQRWSANTEIDPESAVQCELYLAQLAQTENDAPAALHHAQVADAKLRRATQPSESLQASVHEDLGHGYALNNDIAEADRHFEAAVGIMRRLGQAESPAMVAILNNWAIVSWSAGDMKRALQTIDEVIALAGRRGAGAAPPPFAASNRAAALEALGRHAEARDAAELAFAIVKDTAGPAQLLRPLMTKVDAATELHDFAEAERLLTEADALVRTLPEGDFDPSRLPLARARLELLRARPDAARELVQPVITALGDPAQGGATLAYALRLRAQAALALGDLQHARPDAEAALAIGQRLQGGRPHALRTGQAWLLLARVAAGAGDRTGARAAARSALEHLTAMLDEGHDDIRVARQLASD
jgi:tetratricopeptide (TPR) repeat protein